MAGHVIPSEGGSTYPFRVGVESTSVVTQKDVSPPLITPLSKAHFANKGGSCLVVYQVPPDTQKSGVFVDDCFFPGFQTEDGSGEGVHVCYFCIPLDLKGAPDIYLWAEDKAGNRSKAGFYCQVRNKRFPEGKINITDRFLNRILPRFFSYLANQNADSISNFVQINQKLRRENKLTLSRLRTSSVPKQLWEGSWLKLKNAATMRRYGEKCLYYYEGKEIDQLVSRGVDLAFLVNSPVQAANNGQVVFVGDLGVYGLTVVLDHGQGLASTYSHLSEITVNPGRNVEKGDIIGVTGQSGLAGGDLLHFGVMVGGVFVNPIEWWDNQWIEKNITEKLNSIRK